MATYGLVAVTCCPANEVALTEVSSLEHRDKDAAAAHFAKSLSEQLERTFSAVRISRVEQLRSGQRKQGFQEFRRNYTPPTLIFACPLCGGDARVVSRQSAPEFISAGGTLTVLGDLALD